VHIVSARTQLVCGRSGLWSKRCAVYMAVADLVVSNVDAVIKV